MTHPERRITETELHAFLDGELAADDRAEVEAWLATNPVDAGLLRDFSDLNIAIRERYAGRLMEAVPDRSRAILTRIPVRQAERRDGFARRLLPIAAAIVLAALAGAAGYLARGLGVETRKLNSALLDTAIGAHAVYVPEVRHPVEVGAAEEAHLVQWLTKRIGANVRAPTLAALGWKLVGGRLLPDRGLPAAQFMYEDGSGRRLTLYMRKETSLNNAAFQFGEREGFGAFYWVDRPLAYALAGRLSREELMRIANSVYGQLEQR